jgi:hypothetical protein
MVVRYEVYIGIRAVNINNNGNVCGILRDIGYQETLYLENFEDQAEAKANALCEFAEKN